MEGWKYGVGGGRGMEGGGEGKKRGGREEGKKGGTRERKGGRWEEEKKGLRTTMRITRVRGFFYPDCALYQLRYSRREKGKGEVQCSAQGANLVAVEREGHFFWGWGVSGAGVVCVSSARFHESGFRVGSKFFSSLGNWVGGGEGRIYV